MKFGDIVCLKNPMEHESHYEGIYGVIVGEEDGEMRVFFQGDYGPEDREIEELTLIKELKL